MNEVPTTATVSVSQIDTPPVSSIPVVTEPAELETTSFFLMDHPLDLLPQLPVGLGHGYSIYQKDK